MSARAQSQCTPSCARYRSPYSPENTTGALKPFCAAFPEGIPDEIWTNQVDHRQPVEGDHGLQWLAADGYSYPTYAVDTGPVTDAAALTAAAGAIDGAMIALIPSDADAQRLAVEGGEAVAELHCTLVYLGLAEQITPEQRAELFNPAGPEPCAVLILSGSDLAELQQIVATDVVDLMDAPPQHEPYIPHVTLAYKSEPMAAGTMIDMEITDGRLGPITFDRLRLAFAGEITDIPLGEPVDEDDEPEPMEIAPEAEEQASVPAGTDAQIDTVTAAAMREAWDGCPRGFHAAHSGPCPPAL
jgi:hypothetical protein